MALVKFLIALCIFGLANAEFGPCPFNNKCNCMKSTTNQIQIAYCDFGSGDELIKFQPPQSGKFEITESMSVKNFDIRSIPADHFAAFSKIKRLVLVHKSSESPAKLNWDEKAFAGVQIGSLEVENLDSIVPVGPAIRNIDGLLSLSLNSPSPISVDETSFKGIQKLNRVFFVKTQIDKISENAFSGLENQLTELGFEEKISQSNIKELRQVLKKFTKLAILHVIYTELDNLDLADFAGINSNDLLISLFSSTTQFVNFTDNGLKFPKKTLIDFQMGKVTKMDPTVATLITNNPGTVVDVDFTRLGECEDFVWMGQLKCPSQIVISGAKCLKEGRYIDLSQHLKFRVPDTKCEA